MTEPDSASSSQVHSALNLRLALASFGLVVCAVLSVLVLRAGYAAPGLLLLALAVAAAVDLVVVARRRQRRAAAHRGRDHTHGSLFE